MNKNDYSITIIYTHNWLTRWFRNRRFSHLKGHFFAQDLPPNIFLLVRNDETRIMINTNAVKEIRIPGLLYQQELAAAQAQAAQAGGPELKVVT